MDPSVARDWRFVAKMAIAIGLILGPILVVAAMGAGLASVVSNCNRDCGDGAAVMGYLGLIGGGVLVVGGIIALIALPRPPLRAETKANAPGLPDARVVSPRDV
jgi:hypothetical protein